MGKKTFRIISNNIEELTKLQNLKQLLISHISGM